VADADRAEGADDTGSEAHRDPPAIAIHP
jgi:hypothetical protein